jgi:putative nucleotidyltransferase with HDIG domain
VAFDPTVEDQALLEDTRRRSGAVMSERERFAEAVIGIGFLAAVGALWLLHPPHAFAIAPALICLAVLAAATLVRFDTPFGFTVATQLAFVPLLFAMPIVLVPLAVVVAMTVARLPAVRAGQIRPSRLLQSIGNSWFSIGPVAVFVATGTSPRSAGAAVLVAALGAQFVVDFAASALRLSLSRGASLASQLRETWVYAIDAALSGVALVVAKDIHDAPIAVIALLPLLALLAVFARERNTRLEQLLELNNAYRGTALVLGDVVEADDGYTGEHCKSVVALAIEVGERLGLTAGQLRNLEFGALLHDVGKIAIPKEIINKPGKLDPDEWRTIQTHTLEGQKMLDQVGGFMREVGLIVRSHHERWDGDGYPDRLRGEEIPLEARIIACCDTWNAMRTDRSYRKALAHEVAVAEMHTHSGTQFDPSVVTALIGVVDPVAEAAQAAAVEFHGGERLPRVALAEPS